MQGCMEWLNETKSIEKSTDDDDDDDLRFTQQIDDCKLKFKRHFGGNNDLFLCDIASTRIRSLILRMNPIMSIPLKAVSHLNSLGCVSSSRSFLWLLKATNPLTASLLLSQMATVRVFVAASSLYVCM